MAFVPVYDVWTVSRIFYPTGTENQYVLGTRPSNSSESPYYRYILAFFENPRQQSPFSELIGNNYPEFLKFIWTKNIHYTKS